jgi:hypothetical protein
VPFVEPRSRIRIDLPVLTIFVWFREMDSWSIWMSHFDDRPITSEAAFRLYFLPSSDP